MGRPLTFDPQAALEQATALFWRQGYDSTSVSALLDAMAIHRSSFYHAYGDKRSLFLRSLEFYFNRSLNRIRKRRADCSLDALRAHLSGMIVGQGDAPSRDGCLLINTVLEQSGLDEALAGRARDYLNRIQAEFEAWITDLQAAGCVPEVPDAGRRAQSLMCLIKGLRVMAREGESADTLQALIDDFITGWQQTESY